MPAKNWEFRQAMVVVGSARVADGDGELLLTLMLMMMVVVVMIMATDHGEPERHFIITNRLAVAIEPISCFFCFGR